MKHISADNQLSVSIANLHSLSLWQAQNSVYLGKPQCWRGAGQRVSFHIEENAPSEPWKNADDKESCKEKHPPPARHPLPQPRNNQGPVRELAAAFSLHSYLQGKHSFSPTPEKYGIRVLNNLL